MIELVQADITSLRVDAIVNAANSALAGGGGVDGAIHRAAGPQLAVASKRLAPCPPGQAVMTPGFALQAHFVIHAVGPMWQGGNAGESEILRQTYESCFRVARGEPSIKSMAFPAISTGAYGFPPDQAARIAVDEMRKHASQFERVVACVFDGTTLSLYGEILGRLT